MAPPPLGIGVPNLLARLGSWWKADGSLPPAKFEMLARANKSVAA